MPATHRALRSQDSRSSRHRSRPSYQELSTDDDNDGDDGGGDGLNEAFVVDSDDDDKPFGSHKTKGSLFSSKQTLVPPPADSSRERSSRLRRDPLKQIQTSISPQKRSRPSAVGPELEADKILYETRNTKKRNSVRHSRHPSVLSMRARRPVRSPSKKVDDDRKASSALDPKLCGPIPLWASLPYHILVDIFEYAGFPVSDLNTFQATQSAEWLLQCSRLCRRFAEPALTALYRSPALAPMIHAHRLVDLLKADDQHLMTFNYRSKIEALHMEVSQTAAYTLPGCGLLDLYDLVFYLPRLQELELYHKKDMAPFRELDHSVKWNYPTSMFIALEQNVEGVPTKLKSWRWNARLAKNIPIEQLVEFHHKPYFSGLHKLAICNYQVAKLKKDEEDPLHEFKLVEALLALKQLRYLILESSTLINEISMPLLPGVEQLELINCWEVNSHHLTEYLRSHGSQLRHLTLNHNVSLNLSFLTELAALCPRLRTLHMDLTYYDVHQSYKDREPIYDALLEPDDNPTWPASLTIIEFLSIRKWDINTAEHFFQSLLDSADNLPDLRKLVVQGILNIGWRDRASFREKWYEPFDNVFLRHSSPPNPHLRSIPAFKAHQKALAAEQKERAELKANEEVADQHRFKRARFESVTLPKINSARTDRELRQRRSHAQYREDSSSESSEPESATSSASASSNEHPEVPTPPTGPQRKRGTLDRELAILRRTAGFDSPKPPRDNTVDTAVSLVESDEISDEDSDAVPLSRKATCQNKGKATATTKKQFIHGMCDIVNIKIDNLRPAENQYKESDFLDEEPEGDEDWDEGADVEWEAEARYAW